MQFINSYKLGLNDAMSLENEMKWKELSNIESFEHAIQWMNSRHFIFDLYEQWGFLS